MGRAVILTGCFRFAMTTVTRCNCWKTSNLPYEAPHPPCPLHDLCGRRGCSCGGAPPVESKKGCVPPERYHGRLGLFC